MQLESIKAYTHLSDEELLGLVAQQQDKRAYETLYDRHASTIFSLIVRIVRERPAAEELLQETFWQIASQFDQSGAAAAWMFRIGRNRSLDELRRRKARPQPDENTDLESAYQAVGIEQPTAEMQAELLFNRQQIQHSLADLPEEQRACIELAYFEGFSHRQIVEQLGIPIGTVKSRLRIGMEKLERSLRLAGYP